MKTRKYNQDIQQQILKIREGNTEVLAEIIEENSGLVRKVAKKYSFDGHFDDLVQEGYIGLMKAIEYFDPESGVQFSTYATIGIRDQIRKAILEGRIYHAEIHFTPGMNSRMYKIERYIDEHHKKNGEYPTPEQISQGVSLKHSIVKETLFAIENLKYCAFLNAQVNSSSDEESHTPTELKDFISNQKDQYNLLEQKEKREILEKAISTLNEKQAQVLRRYFLDSEGVTVDDIGKELGITKQRASQIKQRALKLLKKRLPEESQF